jgi:hypothetical protein
MRTTKDTLFAIAVRDGEDLWLFLWIKRSPKGDVYVFWPIDEEVRNPHASYHASGRRHYKSFKKAFLPRMLQKPTVVFSGTEQIVTTGIWLQVARVMAKPCRPENYDGGIFEIDASEISPVLQDCRTQVAIDLVSPDAPPLVSPPSAILRRVVFTDAVPHLSITLWDQTEMLAEIAKAAGNS